MEIEPLYGIEIMDILGSDVHVLSAQHLIGRFKPGLIVCNTQPSWEDGGHWIAINITSRSCEFFDSFGRHPSFYGFDTFMDTNCRHRWVYNDYQLQSYSTNACGHHVIGYCSSKMRNMSLNKYVSIFSHNLLQNDFMVADMVKCLKMYR